MINNRFKINKKKLHFIRMKVKKYLYYNNRFKNFKKFKKFYNLMKNQKLLRKNKQLILQVQKFKQNI